MNKNTLLATLLSVAASCAFTHTAWADTAHTSCAFYSHGDEKKDRSGPCTFSQRQGYVDIELKNGKTVNLSPGEKPHHFHDKDGHKVVREEGRGSQQVFKWDHKKIVVSFHQSATTAQSSGHVSVKDMGRYCIGEASAKFDQKPNRIATQDAVKKHGKYSVWGQYEAKPSPQVFVCTFTAEGKFVGVKKS